MKEEKLNVPSLKSEIIFLVLRLVVMEDRGRLTVRRVAAVEGDTVDITEKGLMINGSLMQEPNIYEETKSYKEGIRFPITLQKGEVFLLGDAREHVRDSRIYGAVSVKSTLGKVMVILRRRGI